MHKPPFPKEHIEKGLSLIKAKRVLQLLFSEGTYQIEIAEPKTKKHFWPFLQMDDTGTIIDCFCTCKAAETKKSCAHLAAAYLKIFQETPYPLHVRFRTSLWNQLCQIASRRHGYDSHTLKKLKTAFEAHSVTGKRLFTIKGITVQGRKKVEQMLFHRPVETEETSLKFSNLSSEELLLWREDRPSHHLQYELSFWADLAKWWMLLQEQERYTIAFHAEEGKVPHWIEIRFASVACGFYIAAVNWPYLIPSLATVRSPLRCFEFQGTQIESIQYDAVRRALLIQSRPLAPITQAPSFARAIPVGDWIYIPSKGFFPAHMDPVFNHSEIPQEKIGYVLKKHFHIIEKYLQGTPLHATSIPAKYHLFFDTRGNLHIRCSVFEEGDLMQSHSAYFGPWVYIDGKGFYLLENLLFDGVEKSIARAQMNDFINRHRAWLNTFDGFQTHVFAIESQLRYTVIADGSLLFEAALDATDVGSDFIDFGDWVYLKDKGFFAKKKGKVAASIPVNTPIVPSAVSSFIRTHQEELEHVKGFFVSTCPLEKSGVDIALEAGKISVNPHFIFRPPYQNARIYGDYTFVEAEGFSLIPSEKRLPPSFAQKRTIGVAEEPYFVLHEIDLLQPFILSIQKELIKPDYLALRIVSMRKAKTANKCEWLLCAVFETNVGTISLFDVWQALQGNKRYLFSQAGLIILHRLRFGWLKNMAKRRWLQEGQFLKISTLDFLRISMCEEILLPSGTTPAEQKTKQHIDALQTFTTEHPIDLSGFTSTLRAYQDIGVRWLFFLQMHGLSGLLCDEMGLGKTHQAMGLLAAVHNQSKHAAKFLVVCPTSVIYHWENLLKKFLPHMRVLVFYGVGRKLDTFQEAAGLLLTSYGTLRGEISALASIAFDIAVFDEIQIAKNAHSQTHKALKKIDAAMRVGLTGTPIENRLLELKSLFDVILPGYLPQEAQFKEYFVNPIEKSQDAERKALLARLIHPFILRRKKAEVLLELPEKIEEIAYCDLSEEQRELYSKTFLSHKEALFKEINAQTGPLPLAHIFSLFSALKQICNHPCLITKQFKAYKQHRSGKWDLFVELLEEARDSGQKVVVFSQYLGMLDLFEAYLREHGIGFAGIRGSTRDRKEQIERFRSDPQCEVFVASLQAAGVGIDLISASVVIHYDRWWNPARENQATDRVHRIGQNRGVQVFKMVTKDTIEEHIHRMIERKMTLLEEVISFDEQDQVKGFNRDEIIELLRLTGQDVY